MTGNRLLPHTSSTDEHAAACTFHTAIRQSEGGRIKMGPAVQRQSSAKKQQPKRCHAFERCKPNPPPSPLGTIRRSQLNTAHPPPPRGVDGAQLSLSGSQRDRGCGRKQRDGWPHGWTPMTAERVRLSQPPEQRPVVLPWLRDSGPNQTRCPLDTIRCHTFFLAQTKMSWRSLLTSQYSR